MQQRLRLLLVLVACYQSAADASARWPDDLLHKWHVLLGSGPPRGHYQQGNWRHELALVASNELVANMLFPQGHVILRLCA